MQRLLSPIAIGAALLVLCASSATWSEEMETSTRSASNIAVDAGAVSRPDTLTRQESTESGGAVYMPFSSASPAPSADKAAAPHAQASQASQGTGSGDLFLTLLAVLAGVGALAWLLRRA